METPTCYENLNLQSRPTKIFSRLIGWLGIDGVESCYQDHNRHNVNTFWLAWDLSTTRDFIWLLQEFCFIFADCLLRQLPCQLRSPSWQVPQHNLLTTEPYRHLNTGTPHGKTVFAFRSYSHSSFVHSFTRSFEHVWTNNLLSRLNAINLIRNRQNSSAPHDVSAIWGIWIKIKSWVSSNLDTCMDRLIYWPGTTEKMLNRKKGSGRSELEYRTFLTSKQNMAVRN